MKTILITAAALVLAGCGSTSKLGAFCYVPADHPGQCAVTTLPKAVPVVPGAGTTQHRL